MQPNESSSIYRNAFAEGLLPDPPFTVSQWSDEHRYLSQRASSEPGRWRTDRTPYLREIMDCLSASSRVEEVVFMKGSQIGASEMGLNWLGYIIDRNPGPTMIVLPTIDLAKRFSKQRLDALIDDTPRVNEKVADKRARDSSNTIFGKDFPGGTVILTGANSAVGLRSMPAKYLILDEIDGYGDDADGEGDPIALAVARQRTFPRKKRLKISTPTIDGRSKIQTAFNESSKAFFHVPCPHCDYMQVLKFERLRYTPGYCLDAAYECENCSELIAESSKTGMLSRGEYRHENENKKVRGFHISSLYSPVGWYSWAEICADYEKAAKDEALMKVFVNTVLGDVYKEKGERPKWDIIYKRRDAFQSRDILPAGVLLLTAGVDVQADRLECQVVGWGKNREAWSVGYFVIMGRVLENDVWAELDKILTEQWDHPSGQQLKPYAIAIDTGYQTTRVAEHLRGKSQTRIFGVKGSDVLPTAYGTPRQIDKTKSGKTLNRGIRYWPVGSSVLKSEVYERLMLETPEDANSFPRGYIHFPRDYQSEFFKQLTAEELRMRMHKGFKKYYWEKVYERNEALDTFIYARAAFSICGADRWSEVKWQRIAQDMGIVEVQEKKPKIVEKRDEPKQVQQPKAKKRRESAVW